MKGAANSRRVLLAWELGSGSGHLEVLGDLARRFAARDHAVFLAARNLVTARRFAPTRRLTSFQAPLHPDARGSRRNAVSYGDLLVKIGYRDVCALRALLRGWLALIESTRADLVVADHSPTALLAARIAGIPAAAVGSGFLCPPACFPMPALSPEGEQPVQELYVAELNALAAINRALAAFDVRPLEALAELYPPGGTFLTTYAELDHYGSRPGVDYWGTPDQRGTGEEPRWPRGIGERVFAYLHPHYPQFETMLAQLAKLGHPSLIVAPGISPDVERRFASPNLRIQQGHVDLDRVAECCRVVICHGGHGTIARFLRRGVAPIVVSNYVEQTISAHRLANQGLVFAAHPDPKRHDYATMIQAVVDSTRHRSLAAAFAERHPVDDCDARMEALSRALVNFTGAGTDARDWKKPGKGSALGISRMLFGDPPEESPELLQRSLNESKYIGATDAELAEVRRILGRTTPEYAVELDAAEYLGFVGFPRSGHSLVGAVLDAHPDIVISHELNTLHLMEAGFTTAEVRRLIVENSALCSLMQRQWGRYAHAVPGQFQGRWRELRYLGDKQGGATARAILDDAGRLNKLAEAFGSEYKTIIVVRNPLDNIATISRGTVDGKLSTAANFYLELCRACDMTLNDLGPGRSLLLYQEDFVADPVDSLKRICLFLGLDAPRAYLDACARIVFPSPRASRERVEWYPELLHEIHDRSRAFGFLDRYFRP